MNDRVSIILLWPLALLYEFAVFCRKLWYAFGFVKPHKAGVPVISIGNITAGGTGKTPMAILVAQIIMNSGVRVAVLSRGYKRKLKCRDRKTKTLVVSDGVSLKCTADESGDEPYLMASRLLGSAAKPGAFVIVGKDRVAGAKKAMELGAQAIILDDGFQHWRLARDLDIVLLDSERPLGNGWLLPAGRLREPKNALRRAGAMVFTRCVSEKKQCTEFRMPNAEKPVFYMRHAVAGLTRWPSNQSCDPAELKNKSFLLFSGIARPESFEQSVNELGLKCTRRLRFSDHHRYSKNDLRKISSAAITCDALITTEKDAVRLPREWNPSKPLYVLCVGIEFVKDADTFEKMILSVVK